MPRGIPNNPNGAKKRGPKAKNDKTPTAKAKPTQVASNSFGEAQAKFHTLTSNLLSLGEVRSKVSNTSTGILGKVDVELAATIEALASLRKQVFGEGVPQDNGMGTSPSSPNASVPVPPAPMTLPVPNASA